MTETIRKAQKVEIQGRHVGYQFAKTRMGKRTIQTTVYDIHEEKDDYGCSVLVGYVAWKDREAKVVRLDHTDFLKFWLTCNPSTNRWND